MKSLFHAGIYLCTQDFLDLRTRIDTQRISIKEEIEYFLLSKHITAEKK